jgi:hypothetical protein
MPMVMNYEKVGRIYGIAPKYKEGVAQINDLAKSLHKQGLLPKKFTVKKEEFLIPKSNLDISEKGWEKEIESLDNDIKSIKELIESDTYIPGFKTLIDDLRDVALLWHRTPVFCKEEIVGLFRRSCDAYKKTKQKPNYKHIPYEIKMYPQIEGALTPRHIRMVISHYGLLPNQSAKSPEVIAKEEGIMHFKSTLSYAQRNIVLGIKH